MENKDLELLEKVSKGSFEELQKVLDDENKKLKITCIETTISQRIGNTKREVKKVDCDIEIEEEPKPQINNPTI